MRIGQIVLGRFLADLLENLFPASELGDDRLIEALVEVEPVPAAGENIRAGRAIVVREAPQDLLDSLLPTLFAHEMETRLNRAALDVSRLLIAHCKRRPEELPRWSY
ncbi:MAG: hypothetical protein LC732_00740 [Acidobacteria bacterium]|nr:hypothetical protein [Acidobacteriota bacterium]